MKRIMIIGSCGAGKSTLAKQIHAILGLELIHLDQAYWKAGWVEPSKEEWKEKLAVLLEKDRWIMDGNYGGTMEMRLEKADTVVFLDRSRWVCLYRVFKRIWTYQGQSRPDMAAHCPERFNWPFIKYVYHFQDKKRPGILKRLEKYKDSIEVIRLQSNKEQEQFLKRLAQRKMENHAHLS